MILLFSFLLILGCFAGQLLDLSLISGPLSLITSVCLSFIMMEVGIEFSHEDRSFRSYGWDLIIASCAAILPALLWITYFLLILHSQVKPAILMGISSAPTSAGILFAMLMSAGLTQTWVFKKARVLAVLDDLVTILLLTPLEILIHGCRLTSFATIFFVGGFIFASFRYKNAIAWPTTKIWLIFYAAVLTGLVTLFEHKTSIHLEVLIPAFMWGCLLRGSKKKELERSFSFANIIRAMFMFLVGATFPRIITGSLALPSTIMHVLILTVLANLGKFFLVLCYRHEAPLKERVALGVAMFPRGEVGAAVLLIGLGYGFKGDQSTFAFLSLTLNLILTGFFIWIVIKLLKQRPLPQ